MLKSRTLLLVGSLVISSFGLNANATVITYSDTFAFGDYTEKNSIIPNYEYSYGATIGGNDVPEVPLFDPALGTLTSVLAWVEGTYNWEASADIETVITPGFMTPGGGAAVKLEPWYSDPMFFQYAPPGVTALINLNDQSGPPVFISTPGTYNLGNGSIPFGAASLITDPDWLSAISVVGTVGQLVMIDGAFSDIYWDTTGSEFYGTTSYWWDFSGTYNVAYTYEPASVPEPSSLLLMGIGLAGLELVRRKKT